MQSPSVRKNREHLGALYQFDELIYVMLLYQFSPAMIIFFEHSLLS